MDFVSYLNVFYLDSLTTKGTPTMVTPSTYFSSGLPCRFDRPSTFSMHIISHNSNQNWYWDNSDKLLWPLYVYQVLAQLKYAFACFGCICKVCRNRWRKKQTNFCSFISWDYFLQIWHVDLPTWGHLYSKFGLIRIG